MSELKFNNQEFELCMDKYRKEEDTRSLRLMLMFLQRGMINIIDHINKTDPEKKTWVPKESKEEAIERWNTRYEK